MSLETIIVGDTQTIDIKMNFDPNGGTIRYVVKSDQSVPDSSADLNYVSSALSGVQETSSGSGVYSFFVDVARSLTAGVPPSETPYFYDVQWSDSTVTRTLDSGKVLYKQETAVSN